MSPKAPLPRSVPIGHAWSALDALGPPGRPVRFSLVGLSSRVSGPPRCPPRRAGPSPGMALPLPAVPSPRVSGATQQPSAWTRRAPRPAPGISPIPSHAAYLVCGRSRRKAARAGQEDVGLRLPAPHLRVVAQHHVVEEAEEVLVAAGLQLEGRRPRAGGHGTGHIVLPQVADQLLHAWVGGGGWRKGDRQG